MRWIHPVLVGAGLLGFIPPAMACGESEAGMSCDDSGSGAEMGARWMLKRVVTAIGRDQPAALAQFAKGAGGFRTADTYVFCVGPDGIMNAHPSPILQGQNVHDLHDKTGNYFIKTMMEKAKTGEVSVIRYLFPKPGSTIEEPKITYYTRAGDEVCGVGIYSSDAETAPVSPDGKVAALRARLDAGIPANLRTDWTAFLEAMNAQASARDAAVAKARDSLHAAEAALAPTAQTAASSQ